MAILKITVEGLPKDNGTYEIEDSTLNGDDLHLIKQVSGVRLNELGEALQAGDYDVICALTKIAMGRAGIDVPFEEIRKLPLGSLVSEEVADEKEAAAADAVPPASTPASTSGPDGISKHTGPSSNGGGDDSQVTTPSSIGSQV